MSNQRPRKVRMGSSRRHLDRTSLLAHDVTPETQTDPRSMTAVDMDSVNPNDSEHGNQLDFKEPISETLHETSEDLAFASEKCGSLIHSPTTFEIDAHSNQSRSVSPKPSQPQKEDMSGNRNENAGMSWPNDLTREQYRELSENKKELKMGMLPHASCQKTTLQMSKPADDTMTPEVSQCSGVFWHPRLNRSLYSSPCQPLTDDLSNSTKQSSDSIIHKEVEREFRKEDSNNLAVSLTGTISEGQEYLLQVEGICGDVPSLMKKEHEVSNDVNPLLKQSEHPTQSVVCPLLIEVPNQEEAEQEQVTYTTPDSHDSTSNSVIVVESQPLLTMQYTLNPGNNQTVQDNLENTKRDHIFDLSELGHNMKEKSFSQVCDSEQNSDGTAVDALGLDNDVKQTEVASNQEQDGDLDMKSSRKKRRMGSSRRIGNQGKGGGGDHSGEIVESDLSTDLNKTGKYFETELKVEMKCESLDGETLGTSTDKDNCLLLIPPQSEIKERGSEDIIDRARKETYTGGHIPLSPDISLGDVDERKEVESEEKSEILEKMEVIKIPLSKTLAEENNQEITEKLSSPYHEENLCRAATEPQEKDISPPGAVFDLSELEHDAKEKTCSQECESEGHLNNKPWELIEINPLATVPQHVPSSGEDQCYSVEMFAPTSSQLQDDSEQVGAQTSTGLSHSLGITELDLNKSYLENENENPVEMPEVENDLPQNSDCTAVDASGLDNDVKQTEVASNPEQDGDLDMKSSRKKRRMGSSRRIGNQGKGGGGHHSGEIVESDFSTDLYKTNNDFETELKVEMKCDSESLDGGTLGTSTDKDDCLLLIPPQSEIKERGSEDIIDRLRKETYTGGHIPLSPDISLGDVDERKEVESEEKSDILEKMEVIKIPLSKTLAEENNQEITEKLSSPYHEENFCRAATEPQEKDISPPGAVFDLSELEHDVKEKTCSQECESEGHVNNKPWELIEDNAREEGEGHPIKIGALQSEYSSASAGDEYDLTFPTRSGTISFNDGTVDNPTKLPITQLMEPEKNQSANEKNVTLDSKIELKHGYNNDSNITTEFNPQSEDVEPISTNVTLSDSHSIDDLAVESCLSTNMREINPLATVPQHVPSSGGDQCYSVEMFAPTSSQLQDDSEQVGAETSTGLSHSLGITELGLNKSYLENENENPVEMPGVENDLPQNSDGTAVDASGLDNDVKQTEVVSNQDQVRDLDMKSSRKKRRMGSSRRIGNQGKGGGGHHSGEIVESDFSTDLYKTNNDFETELKVEMKCDSESLEGGTLGTSTDKVDCLLLIPPQSEIKERGNEDIIERARREIYTGGNIPLPPEISHHDVDKRKEDESDPQDKDIRSPGVDFLMLVQNSLSKENAPHSLDINSSILFAPVSDIRDNDDKMDTVGQHQTALSSNVDQISGQGNQGSLPHVKDDDNHILRRRKMGSSRWTKGSATGSQKGSKKAHTTEDKEIEKDAVLSETISEGDPQKLILKDNKGSEKVLTAEEEPNQIGGDTHQSMSEAPKIVRRKLGSNNMTGRMTPIQENTKEKKEVESKGSEDRNDELKMKVNKDNDTEQNGERGSETNVKPVNTTLSALPIELSNDLYVEGRRRKLGSQRKSRGQHHHDYPPESKDHGALNFGDHPPPTEPLSRQISGDATLTFDTLNKCDRRANCFNVVMVGSSNVGKTSFMKRIQSGLFSPDFSASIGIDTCIHALPVDGREVMLQIWDTAGQERFHSISKQIFHKGQAFLLMYDITSSVSFTDVRYWISCIQESAGEEVIMLLLGNKSDCAGRQVTPPEGKLLAKEYNIDFNECSVATGEHIVSSIESLARKLTENYHKIEEDVVLQQQQPKKRCC